MASALILNWAIADVATSAEVAKSPPVELERRTVERAAPPRILSRPTPFLASVSIALDASVAVTLSLGSMPKSVMRSESFCVCSAVVPITDRMSATPCSMPAALRSVPVMASPNSRIMRMEALPNACPMPCTMPAVKLRNAPAAPVMPECNSDIPRLKPPMSAPTRA